MSPDSRLASPPAHCARPSDRYNAERSERDGDRREPHCQVEPRSGRRQQDPAPVAADHVVDDLPVALTGTKPIGDVGADRSCRRGVRLDDAPLPEAVTIPEAIPEPTDTSKQPESPSRRVPEMVVRTRDTVDDGSITARPTDWPVPGMRVETLRCSHELVRHGDRHGVAIGETLEQHSSPNSYLSR